MKTLVAHDTYRLTVYIHDFVQEDKKHTISSLQTTNTREYDVMHFWIFALSFDFNQLKCE